MFYTDGKRKAPHYKAQTATTHVKLLTSNSPSALNHSSARDRALDSDAFSHQGEADGAIMEAKKEPKTSAK